MGFVISIVGMGYMIVFMFSNPDSAPPDFIYYTLIVDAFLVTLAIVPFLIFRYGSSHEHGIRISLIDTETNRPCVTEDYVLTGNTMIDEENINQILIGFEVLTAS